MTIDTIKNMQVGNRFVIVPKTKHTFSIPEEFIIESIKTEESPDPYHPFDKIHLRNENGLVLEFDTGGMVVEHNNYELYDNFQEWFKREQKKVEDKKQAYLLAKKYTEDFEKFFDRFSDENPDKLI
jgi:hypothetical protein